MGVVTVMLQYNILDKPIKALNPFQLTVVQAEILISGLDPVGITSITDKFPNLTPGDITVGIPPTLRFMKQSSNDSEDLPITLNLIMPTVTEYLNGLDELEYAVMSCTSDTFHLNNEGYTQKQYIWTLQKDIVN